MSKVEHKISLELVAIILSALAIVISIVSGIVVPICLQRESQQIDRKMRIQAAIPSFRIVHDKEADDVIEMFKPYRDPQIVKNENGDIIGNEVYYVVRNFSFQNLSSNLVYFSHIEYENEAFELVNLGLAIKENEVITFSEDNRFVGYYPQSKFYIICRSIYNYYYRYECTLNLSENLGDICTYTVDHIGTAEEYDINNPIYKNMYKNVRDILMPPNIIF